MLSMPYTKDMFPLQTLNASVDNIMMENQEGGSRHIADADDQRHGVEDKRGVRRVDALLVIDRSSQAPR